VDALARQGLSSPYLGPEPVVSISPCISRLKVMDWLKERHCEHGLLHQVLSNRSPSLKAVR
jgi:hypothetical protein